MTQLSFLIMIAITSVLVNNVSAARWLKRAFSAAVQSYEKDPTLQCEDYFLIQRSFLSKYGSNALVSVYSWGPGPSSSACPTLNMSFSPMIWGPETLLPPYNATIMPSSPNIKWSSVQGFCNPNLDSSDAAKMYPEEAAKLWPQIIALARSRGDKNTVIVSPAMNECVTNCYPDAHTGDPVNWLNYFLSNCTALYPGEPDMCRFDAIAIHHYGDCTASGLENFIKLMHDEFQKPIWVTEFGCHWWPEKTDKNALAYLKSALPMLENNVAVQRYFYFTGRAQGFNATQLFRGDGANVSLTPVGELYFNYPAKFAD